MVNPNLPSPETKLISEETFIRLHDAMRNLFMYGPHADSDYTVFHDISIDDGMMPRYTPRDLVQRPTHIYSGVIHTHKTRGPSYQVWKRFEGSNTKIVTLHNTSIEPSIVVRKDIGCGVHGVHERNDIITSVDGRAFELLSTLPPHFMNAEMSKEMNDSSANTAADIFEQLAEKVRAIRDAN